MITNLFGCREIQAYVTATEKEPLNQTGSDKMKYIPLFLYSFRWNIETSYYDQKTFWSLCSYMVRSCKGIEMLVNLINICYCAMKILPYQDELLKMDIAKSVTLSNWKSITIFSYAQSEIMILTL